MKKLTTLLLLTGLTGYSLLLSSCANKDKEEETAEAPVEQPKKAPVKRTATPAPAPVVADATAAFLVPKSDTDLPTAEQLDEGKASSIGTNTGGTTNVTASPSQPSTAIKPPTSVEPTEDDLAPAE